MPWMETNVLEQKKLFIIRYKEEEMPFSDLCEEYGISRKTGYKWVKRFETEGYAGLNEMSRCPQNFPQQTPNEVLCEIVRVKNWKAHWGGRKIRSYLKNEGKFEVLPHSRTVERYLKSCGYVTPRKANWRKKLQPEKLIDGKKPNEVWTLDVKGWWRTQDNLKCNPITVRDMSSRLLLNLSAHQYTTCEVVKGQFIELFEEYGLPLVLRSDNGSPFACVRAMHRMSSFSVWIMKHGILPNRMDPASPQQNAAHERFHRDIKDDLQMNPASNLQQEQDRFNVWRYEFNHLRPHESLEGDTPAMHYSKSPRKYLGERFAFEYPTSFDVRKVSNSGEFNWQSKPVGFAKSLAGEHIGIEDTGEPQLRIWFCDFPLAKLDRKNGTIETEDSLNQIKIGRRIKL